MAEATVEILIRAQENVSQAVNEVKQQLEGLTQHAQSVFGRLTQFFQQNEAALNSLAKIGAVVSGTLTALAVAGARHANQLREEALQIGTAVEKYSVYRAMLQDLEIHAEMLPFFIMRMQVAFQQAAQAVAEKGDKVSELTALLAQLGQTVQSQATDPMEQFVALLKEIAKIPDQARQAQLLFELFGRRAYTLLPVLRQGAQEIDNLIAKYRELGVTVSDEAANRIDNLKDSVGTLWNAMKALASEMLATVAPALTTFITKINEAVGAIKRFLEAHPTLASFVGYLGLAAALLGGFAVSLASVGQILKFIGDGLKAFASLKILDFLRGLIGGFGSLRNIVAAVAGAFNPLIAIIGVVALVIGGLIRKIDDATGAISKFLAKLMTAKEARKYVEETVTEVEYTAEQRERDKAELERFYRGRPFLRQLEQEYAQKYYRKVGSLKGLEAPPIDFKQEKEKKEEREKKEQKEFQEALKRYYEDLTRRWSDYIDNLEKRWQEWFNYRKRFYDDIKQKYFEWVDKQKEALERITRAEEEMRQRMAEAYESAARLAANLAARAGVYTIRFGTFGYFAIPVVEEARPVGYRYSRDDLMLSFTFYIYYYAQQIWLSLQQVVTLLQVMVGYLSFLASRFRVQIETEEENRALWRHLTTVAQVFSAGEAIKTRFLSRQRGEMPAETPQLPAVAVYLEGIYWSMQTTISLLEKILSLLASITTAIVKNVGESKNININVPFGYDQIRAAIADAVNEAVGKQLAYELVRNA